MPEGPNTTTEDVTWPWVETELESVGLDVTIDEINDSVETSLGFINTSGLVPNIGNQNAIYTFNGVSIPIYCDALNSYYSFTTPGALAFATTGKVANEITGTPEVGETLTTDDGGWSGANSWYYQWGTIVDSVFTALDGETASTWVVTAETVGLDVTCRVWGASAGSELYALEDEYHEATPVTIV